MDTLPCGHPAKYYRYPRSIKHDSVCGICGMVFPPYVRQYAGDLCGIDTCESDPLAFLQAIVDDPTEYLPRLVFADWLDEQGDPRGELIRVEAELAEPTPSAKSRVRWWYLQARRTALRQQLGYDKPAEPERLYAGVKHDTI